MLAAALSSLESIHSSVDIALYIKADYSMPYNMMKYLTLWKKALRYKGKLQIALFPIFYLQDSFFFVF